VNVVVLGSGTSSGVPTIGCACAVCHSIDPRDNRLRPSILIEHEGQNIVVDTSPDFRAQALREQLKRLDALVFTHDHADHILGFDDIRPFNAMQKRKIPVWASATTLDSLRRIFPYAFCNNSSGTYVPEVQLHEHGGKPFDLLGLTFVPVPLLHGKQTIYGYRIGDFAYLTDHSEIPEESIAMLGGLDVLFLDALRHRPHPTHSTVQTALDYVERLRPKQAYFTHMCHDLPHAATEAAMPSNVRLAYDGLRIEVGAKS
jgi:phosphoribosyl 1,2-cyclic phosphate phosphodiesterase